MPHRDMLALFAYHDRRVKRAIWLLKYRGVEALATVFGRALFDEVIEYLAETASWRPGERQTWVVTPIPLGARRLRQRGFNQAAALARAVAQFDNESLRLAPELLVRRRETAPQASIRDRAARLKNVRGAFAVSDSERVRGGRIILIDDVITTGATMHEARRALYAAGARRVLAAAVAHG